MAPMIPDPCRFPALGKDRVSRFVSAGLFTLAACWVAPGGLVAQGQDTLFQSPGDSLTLAFEREVFAYPDYARRNPFKSLLGGQAGPRFESLLLLGIIYSPFVGESIALFAEGTRTMTPGTGGAPDTYEVVLTGGSYRVREGEIIGNGNVTLRTIEEHHVNIDVEELGRIDPRIMPLPRGTSGGGP